MMFIGISLNLLHIQRKLDIFFTWNEKGVWLSQVFYVVDYKRAKSKPENSRKDLLIFKRKKKIIINEYCE